MSRKRDRSVRIAVTGAAGYLGGILIERLADHDRASYVLATDIRQPGSSSRENIEFVQQDITRPFAALFREHRIDVVVHLAYVLDSSSRPESARHVNVIGTDHVLEACQSANVSHIVYLSSTSVYGAHMDNPDFLTEDDPVRPVLGFQYSENKVDAEKRLIEFSRRYPQVAVTILRVCPVMGPNADNFIANAFRKPVLPGVGSADPPMQFLHEDDLLELLMRYIQDRFSGIYNVAGNGTILWSEMAQVMKRRLLRLPPAVWQAITATAWTLRLQSESPACGLDFVRYRWTVSTAKLRRDLGIDLRYTSRQAWESFAGRIAER